MERNKVKDDETNQAFMSSDQKSNNPVDLGSVIKSPLDVREYKALQLPNGLKVILISTLEVEKSASTFAGTCNLKKVSCFNHSYLGLDNRNIKVRCECPDKKNKKVDKATVTTSNINSTETENSSAPSQILQLSSISEAMKAIRELLFEESEDTEDAQQSTTETTTEEEDEEPPDLSKVASAYLTVGAGWFNDPNDMPGMAHLVEHCLYLGSKKFPWPNQLFRLILPHGGYVNAYTSGEQTIYALSTSLEIFALSLEMLGDAVGSPLLPRDLVSKEMEALDSEYSLRQEDIPKYFQLLASLAKDGHPLKKMDSGNKDTLRVPNFYKKLVEWRAVHYCANYMTLALEAPLTISELEVLAVQYFSDIPQCTKLLNPRARIHVEESPFEIDVFHRIYHVPSIYHSEFMAIHWALEPEAWKNLSVRPLEYISSIINHKGPGGLFQLLSYFGWATNIIGGCWDADVTSNQFTSIFSIYIDMTEEGFFVQDYILEAVFGYLEMLTRNEPSLSFYQECQRQQADYFHQKAAKDTASYAESASIWLQNVPAKFVLVAPHLLAEFDKELMSKYIKMLRVDTCNIMIFSQKFLRNEKMNNMEKFYKTPYASYEFPKGLCEKIERLNPQLSRVFDHPEPNPYLQEITCCGNQQKNIIRNGPILVVQGKCSIYYKDEKFRAARGQIPQAKYVFWLHSPFVESGYNSSNILVKLFASFLNDMIESRFSAALAAHHEIEVSISHGRLELSLIGPSNQLPQITRELFKIVRYFEKLLNYTAFKIGKTRYVQELDNVVLDNRWYAWDIMSFLSSNSHQLSIEHKIQAESVDFQKFIQFVKAFKKRIYVVGHLYGYITADQAFSIVQTVSGFMKLSQKVRSHEIPIHQCPKFPIGESIIRVKSKNPRIHTSVIINGYQMGNISPKESKIASFLVKTMSDAAYYQLRTMEELGYLVIVYHDISYSATTLIIELVTQPKNFSTDYCNSRIDQFLVDFYNFNLSGNASFLEFLKGKPSIDFTLQDIQTLYKKYLLPNSENFRKLSVQVVGSKIESFSIEKSVKPINYNYNLLPPVPGLEEQPLKLKNSYGVKNNRKVLNNNQISTGGGNHFTKESEDINLIAPTDSKYFQRSKSNVRLNSQKRSKILDKIRKTMSEKRLNKGDYSNNSIQKPQFVFSRKVKDIHEFKNKLKLYPNKEKYKVEESSDNSDATSETNSMTIGNMKKYYGREHRNN